MFLLHSLTGIGGHPSTRRGPVCGLSPAKRRRGSLLLEVLENRLCPSMWSAPVNLGLVVNTSSDDTHVGLSPDGLSLYFNSNCPGGFGASGDFDIWVSQRASGNDPWGPAENLGPTINYPGSFAFGPNLSPDGHRLFFDSYRP